MTTGIVFRRKKDDKTLAFSLLTPAITLATSKLI